jgi:pyruvate formate lyase activating enzyme
MREAILYDKLDSGEVKCAVFNHRCVIKEGRRGICGVRENHRCRQRSIEKKPLFHFLPGTMTYSFATVGCDFRCSWCQNWEISQSSKPNKRILGTEVPPEEHVRCALEYGSPSISYTYSEPTIFVEYALDTMKLAHEKGLKNIWHTNGYMTRETLDKIIPYLDAANVEF